MSPAVPGAGQKALSALPQFPGIDHSCRIPSMRDRRTSSPATRHFGISWILLSLSLGIHVLDEAANDFLGFYNPAVLRIREARPWLVLPTFTFWVWLSLLVLAVVVLLSLSGYALRSARGMIPVAATFSAIMFLNGIGHLLVSLYLREAVAGVYSSPLLLAASTYLFLTIPWGRLRTGAGKQENE